MNSTITALLPLIPTLIGPTIRAVEFLFGPKEGKAKLAAATEAISSVLNNAAVRGKLPAVNDPEAIKAVIEEVLADIKADKKPENALFDWLQLPEGSTVTITLPTGQVTGLGGK